MSLFLFSSMRAPFDVGALPLAMLHAEVLWRKNDYDGYRVTRIEHYKEKDDVGHEFHAAYLCKDDEPSEEIIFRIERRPGHWRVASSSAVPSDDSISRLYHNFNFGNIYFHISTTICTVSPPLTVLDFCEICAFIRNVAPLYSLKKSTHCYWFCSAFLIRLRSAGYSVQPPKEEKDYRRRGCFKGSHKVLSEEAVKKSLNSRRIEESAHRLIPAFVLRSPFRLMLPHHPGSKWEWTPGDIMAHTSPVLSMCFSLDGRHIFSGSADGTIRAWDASGGHEVWQPSKGHTDEVNSVAISSDGRRIASASNDKTVRIWDLETGAPVTEPLRGHTHYVLSVAFSPDGRKIVSGSRDESVRIWDVETGAAGGEPLRGHIYPVRSVAWSPDGSRIVSGSGDHTIRVWDAQTGTPVGKPLRGHTDWVRSVAFSPDGSRLVSGSDDRTVRLWDIASQRALGEPLCGHTHWVWSVAFSPDGRWIASGSRDETVRIWDSASGSVAGEVAKLDAGSEVQSVAWSPAGDRVAAGCEDGKIRTWRQVAS